MTKEQEYKEIIRANLDNVLTSGFIPELGEHKKGNVRDVHFSGDKIIMVASDRVSAFDHILSRCIPFKGCVLNLFNQWSMKTTADIVPNAVLESPDLNVIIQKRLENVGFECVVRGYVWGSLAADYEAGLRVKSGGVKHIEFQSVKHGEDNGENFINLINDLDRGISLDNLERRISCIEKVLNEKGLR